MATTEEELAELREEVRQLRHDQDEMASALRARGLLRDTNKRAVAELDANLTEGERANEVLRRAGLLAELTPEERARAAEWLAMPEEERKKLRDEFYNLKLDKSLSDIVIENRR